MNWRNGLVASALMLTCFAAAHAQAAVCANPTKLDGFSTCADVAKAEQEGALVVYTTDPEDGTAAMLSYFHKTFPKIETNYVRLQAGALYAKVNGRTQAGAAARSGGGEVHLVRAGPAHAQSDRPHAARAGRQDRTHDGIRQHRDRQTGGRDRERHLHRAADQRGGRGAATAA